MSDLAARLRALRRGHDTCEDCWYSCPKSAEAWGVEERGLRDDQCTCGADAANAEIDSIADALTQLRSDLAAAARTLANFGLAVLVEMRVDGGGDIDGGWAQDAAEKCGVIEPHEVTEPCRPEGCYCAEYGFPCMCYRDSAAVTAYRASVEAHGQ